jgi:transposase
MGIYVIGIDLGKTVFHPVGVDSSGTVVVRKRCSRTHLLAFTGNISVHRIGMEACGGAHLPGRALRDQGHEVGLMPAQYVKPYVKTNKSDYIDAEAIAEAVPRADDAICTDQDGRTVWICRRCIVCASAGWCVGRS